MTAPPDFAVRAAVEAARTSPCAKSKRGAAVFTGDRLANTGHNAQPMPMTCAGDERCRRLCGKLCLHAEEVAVQAALLTELQHGDLYRDTLQGYDLVHVKVVDGRLVAGGGPSCWQCSRKVLAVRLDGVWLYEAGTCPDGECEIAGSAGNQREICDPSHFRHYGNEPIAAWRYYTALEFHSATIKHCEREGWR